MVGMNCLLYVDANSLLVGCQSGQLVSLDLSSMQINSQVHIYTHIQFHFTSAFLMVDGTGCRSVSSEGL